MDVYRNFIVILTLLRLNTGDILTMDKEGRLYFRSRSKEIITAKGSGKISVKLL